MSLLKINVRTTKTSDLIAMLADSDALMMHLPEDGPDPPTWKKTDEIQAMIMEAVVEIAHEIDRRIPVPNAGGKRL